MDRRADRGGDDDRTVGLILEGRAFLAEDDLRSRTLRLLGQPGDEVAAAHRGQASHVVDELLRVEGGDLAAQMGETVDDDDAEVAHSGVIGGEQPRGARADDEQVTVDHASRPDQAVGERAPRRRGRR